MSEIQELSDDARIWIYQAQRPLNDDEIAHIQRASREFLLHWTSHGASLRASIEVYRSRLLVVAVDEQSALPSGCGIDKSVRFVEQLGEELKLDFFQRTVVLYQDGVVWNEATLSQFWAMRKALIIDDNTRVIDTSVRTLGAFRNSLEKPFSQSWHAEMWGR